RPPARPAWSIRRDARGPARDLAGVVALGPAGLAAGGRQDAAAGGAVGLQLSQLLPIGRQGAAAGAGGQRHGGGESEDEDERRAHGRSPGRQKAGGDRTVVRERRSDRTAS